jgi:hypothetical protein
MRIVSAATFICVLSLYAVTSAQAQHITERPFARQQGFFLGGRLAFLASGEESVLVGITGGAVTGRHFAFGLGVEYDSFENGRYLPIFLALRTRTSAQRASPILGVDFGTAVSTETARGGQDKYGLLLSTVVGFEQFTSKHFAIRVETGLRMLWFGADRVSSPIAGFALSLHPPR